MQPVSEAHLPKKTAVVCRAWCLLWQASRGRALPCDSAPDYFWSLTSLQDDSIHLHLLGKPHFPCLRLALLGLRPCFLSKWNGEKKSKSNRQRRERERISFHGAWVLGFWASLLFQSIRGINLCLLKKKKEGKKEGKEGYRNELRKKGKKEKKMQTALLISHISVFPRSRPIVVVESLSHVWFFVTPWTVSHQVPLAMEFSRQEYWSGLSFPSPGTLPDRGIELESPALAGGFFTTDISGKPSRPVPLSEQPLPRVVLLSTPTQTSAGGHQSISPSSTHEKSLWMESVLFKPVLHTPLSEKTLTWFQCETWGSATGWQLISRLATHPEKKDSSTESTARGLWLSHASRACCVQSVCAT